MWSHMEGWGPGWGWFMLSHVLWWLALVVGIAVLLGWAFRQRRRGPADDGPDRALDLLRERYARGEISQQEFEERKRVLGA